LFRRNKNGGRIDFHLKRYLKDGHIYKEIDFEDKGQKIHFTEKSFNTARL
jgi:hypothetical protein